MRTPEDYLADDAANPNNRYGVVTGVGDESVDIAFRGLNATYKVAVVMVPEALRNKGAEVHATFDKHRIVGITASDADRGSSL